MKKLLVLGVAALTLTIPLTTLAQSEQSCTTQAECTGVNEMCDTGLHMCVLNQTGVNNVTSHTSSGTTGGPGLNTQQLQRWSDTIVFFINGVLVPLLTAVAFIVFLYGVFNYFILGGDNDEKRKIGRTYVIYGILGFVIIFSLWGLVYVGVSLLNVPVGGRPGTLPYPTL